MNITLKRLFALEMRDGRPNMVNVVIDPPLEEPELTQFRETARDRGKALREALRGGFEDDPQTFKMCTNPSHNPPTHLYIPYGKVYRHICPGCGYEIVLRSSADRYGKEGMH